MIIHLEVGQPNFKVPIEVKNATIASLMNDNTTYIANDGLFQLRNIVSQKFSHIGIPTNVNQIVITVGNHYKSLFSIIY